MKHNAILLVLFGLSLCRAATSCMDYKYPLGLGGQKGDIQYTALDIDSTGAFVIVGGQCLDADICTSNSGQPVIEMYDESYRQVLWSKYFKITGTIEAIKFQLDSSFTIGTASIAVALSQDNNALRYAKMKASDGAILKLLEITTTDISRNYPQSLLYHSDADHLTAALQLNNRWTVIAFSLATGQVKFYLRNDYTKSFANALISDSLTDQPSGIYVVGKAIDSTGGFQTYHHSYVDLSTGTVRWALYQDPISPTAYQEFSFSFTDVFIDSQSYLWSCGSDQQKKENVIGFTKLKVDKAFAPVATDMISGYLNKADAECYGLKAVGAAQAYFVGMVPSGKGANNVKEVIGMINMDAHALTVSLYNTETVFDFSGNQIGYSVFNQGVSGMLAYFVGQLSTYNAVSPSQKSGFLMKLLLEDGTSFSDNTCTTFNLHYVSTGSIKLEALTFTAGVSYTELTQLPTPSDLTIIAQADQLLYDTVISSSTTLRSFCSGTEIAMNLVAPSLSDQSFDITYPSTTNYQIPEFQIKPDQCNSHLVTYADGTISMPSNIHFDQNTRIYDWAQANTAQIIPIQVQATIKDTAVTAIATFTLSITQTPLTPVPPSSPPPSPPSPPPPTPPPPPTSDYTIYPNLGPPYFDPPLSDLTLTLGDTKAFKFPNIFDLDPNDSPTVVALIGPAEIMTGKFPNLFFKPMGEHTGTFQVAVTLKDNNKLPLSATYSFNVIVVSNNKAKNTTKMSEANNSSSQQQEVIVPQFAINKTKMGGGTKLKNPLKLMASIDYITNQGLVILEFNKDIVLIQNISSINEKVISLQVVPGADSIIDDVQIACWNVVGILISDQQENQDLSSIQRASQNFHKFCQRKAQNNDINT